MVVHKTNCNSDLIRQTIYFLYEMVYLQSCPEIDTEIDSFYNHSVIEIYKLYNIMV